MVPLSALSMEGDMAENWKKYLREFETYIDAYHEAASAKKKVSILLHHAGSEAREIYDSFQFEKEAERYELNKVIEKFTAHFVPTTNITYERFMFLTRRQKEEESFEQFMTVLKTAAKKCNLGSLKEELVKDIFICGINDTQMQQALLRKPELNATSALEYCRTRRVVTDQLKTIKKEEVGTKSGDPLVEAISRKNNNRKVKDKVIEDCQYCGYRL